MVQPLVTVRGRLLAASGVKAFVLEALGDLIFVSLSLLLRGRPFRSVDRAPCYTKLYDRTRPWRTNLRRVFVVGVGLEQTARRLCRHECRVFCNGGYY